MARKPKNTPNSWRKNVKDLKSRLKATGLEKTPFNNFDEKTKGGILGTGLLKARPNLKSGFDNNSLNVKGNPIYINQTVPTYTYFFLTRENPSVRGDDGVQYSFYIIEAILPISVADCAKQLGVPETTIKAITEDELNYSFFNHPVYINGERGSVKIYYGEVMLFKQNVPGRMDDMPFGFPAFNYNPSPTQTSAGVNNSPPYTQFHASGHTDSETVVYLPFNDVTESTIQFIDSSLRTPPQVRPTSWLWDFGHPDASPSTSTEQNPTVDYFDVPSGTYNVTLTATNASGSTTLVKEGYLIISEVPVPNFYVNGYPTPQYPVTIPYGATIQFIDNSLTTPVDITPTSWSWTFGTGPSPTTSTDQNPTVDFSGAIGGYYNISLTASNIVGSSVIAKNNYIINPGVPNTDFYVTTPGETSHIVPITGIVTFTDNTPILPGVIAPSSWDWSFGPSASPTGSTDQNPTVDFSFLPAGTYDITLTTNNFYGNSPVTKSGFIISDGVKYLGESYPDESLFGFSLRQLTDSDVEVALIRRDSDSTSKAFKGSEILLPDSDPNSLLYFVGATGNGTVRRLYQQFPAGSSGITGGDLFAASSEFEPLIVDAGVLLTLEGEPAMYFDGTKRMEVIDYDYSGGGEASPFTIFAVGSLDDISSDSTIISGNNASDPGFNLLWVNGGTGAISTGAYNSNTLTLSTGTQHILFGVYDPSTTRLGLDALTDSSFPSYNTPIIEFQVGHLDGANNITGYIQEILIYNTNMYTGGANDPLYEIRDKLNNYYQTI